MHVADAELVGRDGPLARIREAAQDAATGTPRAVLVTGEAGIGKTRLVESVATDHADAGWRVAVGRAVRLDGGSPPYLPFVQLLHALVAGFEPARARQILGGARNELSVLIPDLVPDTDRAAAIARSSTQRHDLLAQARLFESLLDIGERAAADRPLLMVVEDAQWLDPASADLLRIPRRPCGPRPHSPHRDGADR